ncbi:MAG TPA: class I SAM-dependent methyltransferase [Pyrinomonadaceae bacterium]|nr:class I SAM-dependent methyltransferase [Pyrinomonadaceae bacterium]
MRVARLSGSRLAGVAVCAGLLLAALAWAQQTGPMGKRDVPYVPTPEPVVNEMLSLAKVSKGDVVYDLGCGDGRLVITAVKKFGARKGVGVDIDPVRVRESNENAQKAGVTDRVKFVEQDLFETDFSEATVVTLYLLPDVNLRLRPKLLKELKPGTRIVSHAFDMGDWKPEKVVTVEPGGQTIYFWTVPASGAAPTKTTPGH